MLRDGVASSLAALGACAEGLVSFVPLVVCYIIPFFCDLFVYLVKLVQQASALGATGHTVCP